ncbi:TetR/AcrR family transcriptional regulator [Nocardiopsis mangrovi]|uniref:TetR/AcrR family transcriptional regulator n=1 Tax=Nocardiopsis mangrovi TaxID=1179818 RepID=A0ABV9E082_9ACTN
MSTGRPYHHGDLRQAVLSAAVDAIAESGPAGVSLRDLARRAGVSHAAPAHHFGDKAGLLTAIAAEGYAMLADALHEAQERTRSYREVGVAYVRFAVEHRAHFAVMFQPALFDTGDAAVAAARARADRALTGGVDAILGEGADPDRHLASIGAWSLVHGFATLWLNGSLASLDERFGDDSEAAARAVVASLFPA